MYPPPSPPREQRAREVLAQLCRDEIARCGAAAFLTAGGSMRPLIRPGDTLHVAGAPPEALKVSDVVAFSLEGRLVAHRVLRVLAAPSDPAPGSGGRAFLLKGDASLWADGRVSGAEIIGKVVARERAGRRRPLDRGPLAWGGRAVAVVSLAVCAAGPLLRLLRSLLRRRRLGRAGDS